MNYTQLLTSEDKDLFDRIDKDCLAMHIAPPPKTFLKLEVFDNNGNLTDVYEDRAHSWVRNAYNFYATNVVVLATNTGGTSFGEGALPLKTTSGSTVQNTGMYLLGSATVAAAVGGAGVTNTGIVIGTGTGTESFESYGLGALIAHGTGSGQMSYSAQDANSSSYNSGTKKWTFTKTRSFQNGSGASIVVGEVGCIYALSSGVYAIMYRDLLASAVTVVNSGTIVVTYTIEMTYPA